MGRNPMIAVLPEMHNAKAATSRSLFFARDGKAVYKFRRESVR
jgi:hypothetical protein